MQYKCGGKQLNISLLEDNPLDMESEHPPPAAPDPVHRELKSGLRPDEYEEFGVQVCPTAELACRGTLPAQLSTPEPPTEAPAAFAPLPIRNGSCLSSDIDGCSDNESYQSSMPNASDTEGLPTSNLVDICRMSHAMSVVPRTPHISTPAQPQSCRRSPAPPLQRNADSDYTSLIALGSVQGEMEFREWSQLLTYLRSGVESEFQVCLKEVNNTRRSQRELTSRLTCRAETILLIEEGSVAMGANPDKIPTVLAGRLNTLHDGIVRKRSLAAVGLPLVKSHIDVASLKDRMVLAKPRLWDLLHPTPTESPTNAALRDWTPSRSCSFWRDAAGIIRHRGALGVWRTLSQHALVAQSNMSVNCLMLYVNRYLILVSLRSIYEGEPLLCHRPEAAHEAMVDLFHRQSEHVKLCRQQSLAPAAGDVCREVEPTFRKSEVYVTESTASADSLSQEHPIEYHMDHLRECAETVLWSMDAFKSSMAEWPTGTGVMYCSEILGTFSKLLKIGHAVNQISEAENWASDDPRSDETERTLTQAALMAKAIRPFIDELAGQDYFALLSEKGMEEAAPVVQRILEIDDTVWMLAEQLSSQSDS